MSMTNIAGFVGASLGLPLGLPLPGELEPFPPKLMPPKPMLRRLSLLKNSITVTEGFRSVLFLLSKG